MNKKAIVILSCILVILSMTACSEKSVQRALTGNDYQAQLSMYVENNDNVGVTCPLFYAVGDKYVVAVSYFGMFVLEPELAAIYCYVDLKDYDCNNMQGDIITEVILDNDEENIYFYNVEKDKVVGKIYSLNIDSKNITEVSEEKLPNDMEVMSPQESVKWRDISISSKADEWKISNLKFVFTNESSGEVKELKVVGK